ncbi:MULTISPECIES: sulfate reduction electron transfer complex DsrMKJOP subunit DsrO [Prosthecochloris]|uniref:4Fe-4S ferredoxin n=1 Tax=Prosthecochloris marina TaxID=2017681 RepID=A0A317T3C9_9CHLB|nr:MULTISPECIES: 4Fe-4S dicluster domain-containing protein [Prosthecochloris]PWW81144.1 4Fe-4S ferredoxin [Prosthecochloris marina]UZJ38219.1 4Fe-4S dicluster domain-containing protein [Prosthecochloris sp. SCSIO W1103]
MNENRREFIKKTGLGVLAGLGVASGIFPKSSFETAVASTTHEDSTSGKRWGMVIDTRKCKDGCTKCIDACHEVHNVPDFDNIKDEIKWIWKSPYGNVFPGESEQFVSKETMERSYLALCNHCDNPPCVRACPTKATFKRDWDGIVAMDYHRCIGCRFCMAACPYGARSFNWRDPRPAIQKRSQAYPTRERGVVEKCNFCSERLAQGLQPACVAECSEGALTFGDLNDPESEVRMLLEKNHSLQRRAELGTRPSVFYII